MASLENGKHGLVFASGLGATTALAALLESGDHLLCCDDVYGGTNRYFKQCLSKNSISVTFTDATSVKNVVNAIQPNTKVIFPLLITIITSEFIFHIFY